MPIRTAHELRKHLALAMRVELSTIPPYLYAMYSIENEGSEAARLLRSVVTEEMLHLALAANLLVAVGGDPRFLDLDLRPTYPGRLAHHRPELPLHLAPASMDVIRSTFLVIEQPEPVGAAAEADGYHTIGQFYSAIEAAIERLAADGPLFANPRPECQLGDPAFYGPVEFDAESSGGLVLVHDLSSAREALEIIVHQGEGLAEHRWADPAHKELTHYAKLLRIADGASPIGPVRPARLDPRSVDYPPGVRPVADVFNAVYRALFHILDRLYQPVAAKVELVDVLYTLMAAVLGPVARYLMTLTLDDGTVAGPTFEPYDLGVDPPVTLARLAARVRASHPPLSAPMAQLLDASSAGWSSVA